MNRKEARSVGDILGELLKAQHLDGRLNETRLIQAWGEVAGEAVAQYTSNLYIRDGVLYVSVASAVLRNELMMCRQQLQEKLNARVGSSVINNIVFR